MSNCSITHWHVTRPKDDPYNVHAHASFNCGMETEGVAPTELVARLYAIRQHPHGIKKD